MANDIGYILNANQRSIDRLHKQHQLYEQSSQRLLKDAGLCEGMRVLEVGCGPGLMTPYLCAAVGDTGHVTALDAHEHYIELTQVHTQAYNNIDYLIHDIRNINELDETYDMIYGRMILHHLSAPEQVLEQLVCRLKKSGRIVFEEPPALEHTFSWPKSDCFMRAKQVILELFEKKRVRYQIAYTMANVLRQIGLNVIETRVFQPLLTGEARLLHVQTLLDFSHNIIDAGILNESELGALINELSSALAAADCVSLYQMHQVIAQR